MLALASMEMTMHTSISSSYSRCKSTFDVFRCSHVFIHEQSFRQKLKLINLKKKRRLSILDKRL